MKKICKLSVDELFSMGSFELGHYLKERIREGSLIVIIWEKEYGLTDKNVLDIANERFKFLSA